MDPEDRQTLQRLISTELVKVKEDISSLEEQTRPVAPDNAIGRVTRMEAIGARSINEAKLGDAKGRLVMLERALARINNPDFGACAECGDKIPLARLRLMPETSICVECASDIP